VGDGLAAGEVCVPGPAGAVFCEAVCPGIAIGASGSSAALSTNSDFAVNPANRRSKLRHAVVEHRVIADRMPQFCQWPFAKGTSIFDASKAPADLS
jgi:hypothetical protein